MKIKTINVQVTQIDIDGAEHKKLCNCPIARAMNKSLGTDPYPRIIDASIRLDEGHCTLAEKDADGNLMNTVLSFMLQKSVMDFVNRWDANKSVSPFSFVLELKNKGPRFAMNGTL